MRQSLVQIGLAVLLLAVVGVVAGFVWEWVWTAPDGAVVDGAWVAQDEANLRGVFSGTAWYVVVASAAGLIGGALVALLLDRFPLATLLGLVVGSLLGAFLMLRVGVALGPGDPVAAARSAGEGATVPGVLAVSGSTPFVAMPAGALVALALVFIGLMARDRVRPG
ncbi:hypothetical protein [Nocardioides hungaricus]